MKPTTNFPRALTKSLISTTFGVLALVPSATLAVSLADTPLFLGTGVKPNIMLVVDDSGSMDSEILMPTNDGALWWHTGDRSFVGRNASDAFQAGTINYNQAGGANGTWKKYVYLFPNGTNTGARLYADSTNDHYAVPPRPEYAFARSAEYNKAYYDPTKTYTPWPSTYGTNFPDATPTAAKSDPVRGTETLDLTTDLNVNVNNWKFRGQIGMRDSAGNLLATDASRVYSYFPATYYVANAASLTYDGTRNCATPNPSDYLAFVANPSMTLPADVHAIGPDGRCLTRYEIKPAVTTYPSGRTYADEIQNFANWFTYSRKRHIAMRGGTLAAFDEMSGIRTGLFRFNNRVNPVTMLDFDSERTTFFDTLKNFVNAGGTPTRLALQHAGTQYRQTGAGAPIQERCQKNFAIVFTDGFANQDNVAVGNADGASGSPYSDPYSGTMGDIAMYHYNNNLRTDLTPAGDVPLNPSCYTNPPDSMDCNPNLHMVTYAVTLGAQGSLFGVTHFDTQDAYDNPPTWQAPTINRHPVQVDDLYHATVNGRGEMLNATSSDEIVIAMKSVLADISNETAAGAALAANSTRLSTDTVVYQAILYPRDWTGELRAIEVTTDGAPGSNQWTEANMVPVHGSRNIQTWNGTNSGLAFQWSSLTSAQKNLIDSANASNPSSPIMNYLRGDKSNEIANGGTYRNRSHPLGDIVNSDPYYAGAQNWGYNILAGTEGATYMTHLESKKNGTKMVYVGANDGMLHGFRDTDGLELLAYVPNAVIGNLANLASPSYAHQYYVDGPSVVGDAYLNSAWKSILVGSTGAGAKAVFALDVTNPDSFDASKVMWEFTSSAHSDLGYPVGRPMMAKLNNGRWAAIFGNGYESTGGDAKLFIIYLDADLSDGWTVNTDYVVIDTLNTTGNGLSAPTLYDSNNDRIVDYAYAGDLLGNLWKFDLSSSNPSQWGVYNKTGSTPKPFFTAKNASNQIQPITGGIEIGVAPPGETGVMLFFGTGQYLATGDITNAQIQSFYGLWDTFGASNNSHIDYGVSRTTKLVAQTILYEGDDPGNQVDTRSASSHDVRVTSNETVDYDTMRGWFMDLITPPNTLKGERVVSTPILRFDRVVFATLIPSTDPCVPGGTSWLMELTAATGSRLDYSAFDLNDDAHFDNSDFVTVSIDDDGDGNPETVTVPISSMLSTVGIIDTPTVVSAGEIEYKLAGGTSANIMSVTESGDPAGSGRVSWRQLINE
ncbi:MAG: pilus assembly protein [Pseudomonadota bacterium]